jgi:hypothetical protein
LTQEEEPVLLEELTILENRQEVYHLEGKIEIIWIHRANAKTNKERNPKLKETQFSKSTLKNNYEKLVLV